MILWHYVPMATAQQLNAYFEDWLGASVRSEQEIIHLVEAGLPLKIVPRLIQRGLTRDEILKIIINPRTLKPRRSKRQPLSKEESERVVRAVRILARAEAVMGGLDAALRWLRSPKRRFEGRSPLAMLSTETGGRMVEQMLVQIDEGMFA